ncbi:MAG TPA: BREX-1 system phosphatase PglZ type B [Thermoguttaceae bacterium]|nr:BREX-1 system phosphatase PglZ type B [Thermoguttaceae bacterium]
MPDGGTTNSGTVFDAIVASLIHAARYNPNDQVQPTVILWTDNDRLWEPLVSRIQDRLPQLLVLGDYAPDKRSGPAIWLRCVIARKLPEPEIPDDAVPILYLPGISRQELRAVEDCAEELQPLAELQYRGVFWTQVSAKDWTICAFLKSQHGGLGLDVARDKATKEAILRALNRLVEEPVERLRVHRIDAGFLNGLLTPDPVRDLLEWLNGPEETQRRWEAEKWSAFCIGCRQTYAVDLKKEGALAAAEKLGRREGAWQSVWSRFAEAPTLYPGIPDWLRRARPPAKEGTLPFMEDSEPWPQDNEKLEGELREAIVRVGDKSDAKAREAIEELENSHRERRGWPWAKFGWSPLARAIEHLAVAAEATKRPLTGPDVETIARVYVEDGWRADATVLDALACAERAEDVAAVSGAVAAIYQPWLADGAAQFQKLVAAVYPATTPVTEIASGCCLLFADGLRFDLGQKLLAEIQSRGWESEASWGWARMPTVTATAKPAVSPVADQLDGDAQEEQFRPRVHADGKPLTHDRFKRLLQDQGVQFLAEGETGDPAGRAWTECGSIDRTGHKEGIKLARRIGEELRGLVDRIRQLLDAGWKEVRIATDHGWLLLPGGLPKVAMPKYLTATQWGRCAIVREGSKVDVPMVPWGWCGDLHVAVPTGIGAFRAGLEYDHGGLSLQECLVPSFTVHSGVVQELAKIESIAWRGLRCRIEVTGGGPGWQVDLRASAADVTSSLVTPHPVDEEGRVSVLVKDKHDDKIGHPAVVVLISPDGQVTNKRSTLVGGED